MSAVLILGLLKRFWPLGVMAAILIAGGIYVHDIKKTAYDEGRASMQAQIDVASLKANEAARQLEQAMQNTSNKVADQNATQQTAYRNTVEPEEKALNEAIKSDPNSNCTISDSVRDDLQAIRSSTNAAITTSGTRGSGPKG